jgi:hypothetical protein
MDYILSGVIILFTAYAALRLALLYWYSPMTRCSVAFGLSIMNSAEPDGVAF